MAAKSSQSSLEFIIILSFLLIIFLVFIAIFDMRKDEFAAKPDEFAAKTLAESVALSVNKAFILGSGSVTYVFVPDTLYHTNNFSISIYGSSRLVNIEYGSRHYSYPILTSDIESAELQKGAYAKLTNLDGRIDVG